MLINREVFESVISNCEEEVENREVKRKFNIEAEVKRKLLISYTNLFLILKN